MAGPNTAMIEEIFATLKMKIVGADAPGSGTKAEITDECIELLTSMKETGRTILIPDAGGIELQ